MQTFEVEIKVLLGQEEYVKKLKELLYTKDPTLSLITTQKQLNHYFTSTPDTKIISEKLSHFFVEEKSKEFEKILTTAKNISFRTRESNGKILFVMKAAIDDTTSANGTARIEFEEEVKVHTLHELDNLLLEAGLNYEAKWSREREEYQYKDMHVCIDKNAGYGFLAEFEKMAETPEQALETKEYIRKELHELGVEELPQDRLARMFDFYNTHWQDYYGTNNVFTVL